MGVTLEVTMGVHIIVGTWGSPDQSMAGQQLALSNTVSQKIRFALCEVSSRRGVFLWANKKNMPNFIAVHRVLVAPASKS